MVKLTFPIAVGSYVALRWLNPTNKMFYFILPHSTTPNSFYKSSGVIFLIYSHVRLFTLMLLIYSLVTLFVTPFD